MQVMKIDLGFCLYFVCVLLLIPLRLVAAWILAVSVHEFSHYLALRICGIKIKSLKLRFSGMLIETEPMDNRKEIVCALAGPAGGFLVLLFARVMPCTAICAFVQSCYNLLPVFPLDGGRVLRSAAITVFGAARGSSISAYIGYFTIGALFVLVFFISFRYNLPMLALCYTAAVSIFLLRGKFPCKQP